MTRPHAHPFLSLARAARLVWDVSPWLTTTILLVLLVQGVLPVASLYAMKLIIDTVAGAVSAGDSSGASVLRVASLVGVAGSIALATAFLRIAASYVREVHAERVTNRVQDNLYAHAVAADLEHYESALYHDKLHRALIHARSRPSRFVTDLVECGRSITSLAAVLGLIALSVHWMFAILLLAAAVPASLLRLQHASDLYNLEGKRTTTERRLSYFHWLLTGDVHAKEIRLFGLGSLFMQRATEARATLQTERRQLHFKYSAWDLTAETVQVIAIFASIALLARRAILGSSTIGDLAMYYQAFQRARESLHGVAAGIGNLYGDALFVSSLFEFLDLRPKLEEPDCPVPVPRPIRVGIEFNHVTFAYPDTPGSTLDDVTLTIRPGEHVALVGENGAGKTTFIKLLCRFYDPNAGRITIDGIDIRHVASASLRREISVMFQDYVTYGLTARENVWVGDIERPPSDGAVVAAAQRSGADVVIARLRQGYETMLGRWFVQGQQLSVGEWQKIALARAFLREAQIIVLDEPTSALDPVSEHAMLEQFRELIDGKTAILVSHRLSTVRMADRIVVLDRGRIVESGSHEELIRQQGTYARLFAQQAKLYC